MDGFRGVRRHASQRLRYKKPKTAAPSCTPPPPAGGTSKKRCHLCHKEHNSIIAKRTTILPNPVNVCCRETRGLTSAVRKENRAKQVEDPSSAVEAHSLGVSILRTFAKVLTEPGKRYSRGPGIRRRFGKSSPKEGLHSAPPTPRHTRAGDCTPSNAEIKDLLRILKCHCHLTTR
ncbi:hypothetical protein PVAP13_4KG314705 [Panicum virgatum]|uniref:Uncharacterized protein n=1 Tax=Panicum virgatum TaxID=38727 RepID=A0A8T0TV91_PANVG|nr:hypothetical protein PVAP13_4KG314705 [Panicum virgatum]